MEGVTLHLDFVDIPAYKIYSEKFVSVANILGVAFKMNHAVYGDSKVYAKMVISGNALDIDRFVQFVESSMELMKEA